MCVVVDVTTGVATHCRVDVLAPEMLPGAGFGLGVGVNVAGKSPREGVGRARAAVLPPPPNGVDMGMAANGSVVDVAAGVSVGGIEVDVGVTLERKAAPRMGGLVTTTNAISGTRTNKKALLDMHPSPNGESETAQVSDRVQSCRAENHRPRLWQAAGMPASRPERRVTGARCEHGPLKGRENRQSY
jgi:hypothetical protein